MQRLKNLRWWRIEKINYVVRQGNK